MPRHEARRHGFHFGVGPPAERADAAPRRPAREWAGRVLRPPHVIRGVHSHDQPSDSLATNHN